jgi:dTDP-4-amino-4,6-dideoxygalactose transaminase
MYVPLIDLKAQYREIKGEILQVIGQVCEGQGFILGPHVQKLEEEIAAYLEINHAIGVASGSDALLLSLMAMGVGPGDEVITTPYTFIATAGAISRLGARPVFVDILPQTLNIHPGQIEGRLTERTKAIIPVHLFGQCCEMGPILKLAGSHQIKVIEDAAQAIGAAHHDQNAGTMGDLGCFSFFPTKNLGGFGDGGMIIARDGDLARRLRRLRVHGSEERYYHKEIGCNSRLDELQAAVLRVKLHYLEKWNSARRERAKRYHQLFTNAALLSCLKLPEVAPGNSHVFHQYVIRTQQRDKLRHYLKEKGVDTEIYYPVPLHLQACYQDLGHREGDFPESERLAKEALALPIYPELTDHQQSYVVEQIESFYT